MGTDRITSPHVGLSLLPLLSSFFTMTSQTADTTKDNATRPESQSASSSTRTAELASTKKKLHTSLRNFPDFPIKGIDFVDILPLFAEFEVHTQLIRALELEVLQFSSSRIHPSFNSWRPS